MSDFVVEFYDKVKAYKASVPEYNTVVLRDDFADKLIEAICGEPPTLTNEFSQAQIRAFQISKLKFILGYVIKLNVVIVDRAISTGFYWALGY